MSGEENSFRLENCREKASLNESHGYRREGSEEEVTLMECVSMWFKGLSSGSMRGHSSEIPLVSKTKEIRRRTEKRKRLLTFRKIKKKGLCLQDSTCSLTVVSGHTKSYQYFPKIVQSNYGPAHFFHITWTHHEEMNGLHPKEWSMIFFVIVLFWDRIILGINCISLIFFMINFTK